MWSITYRELINRYFGVRIGLHSYGPCLNPGLLPSGTRVGNYCSFAAGLKVFRRNHPVDRLSQHPFFFNSAVGLLNHDTIPAVEENPLTIGHDVWIGENVIIGPGCRDIGDSSVVASGAVVTSNVPAFAIVGGVPAKLIRQRLSEELRAAWLKSRWWLSPVGELTEIMEPFTKAFALSAVSPQFIPPLQERSLPVVKRS
ncbi:MAG TPA: CatB-related O-acetyltransferase [Candidatus Dormibacteraeota bacterium]|nr:CatB-related O-acetyltransferase [Candidatus Dormibacteraeota bacterium]